MGPARGLAETTLLWGPVKGKYSLASNAGSQMAAVSSGRPGKQVAISGAGWEGVEF